MAPSSGHLLVPKAVRILKFAASKTKAFIRSKISQSSTSNVVLQPIRIHTNTHSVHSKAFLRQSHSQHRWFATIGPKFCSGPSLRTAGHFNSSVSPASKTGKAIARRGAAPFSSTLRPNLTGGALPRSAGGYSLGGTGARHFSHTPSIQAQVVQNVSAGIRAFIVNGGKARFDGFDGKTGEKRFKAVSKTQDEVLRKIETPFKAPPKGTNLDFHLSPTMTAFSTPFSSFASNKTESKSLNDPSFLPTLSTDFARAFTDLSTILADLNLLAALGDLPLSLVMTPSGPVLTLRFPGCDAYTVSRLCEEVGVRRGVIREDEAWDQDRDVEMALLFPFAPTENFAGGEAPEYFEREPAVAEQMDWRHMMSLREDLASNSDRLSSDNTFELLVGEKSPRISKQSKSPSGYESLRASDFADDDPYIPGDDMASPRGRDKAVDNNEYEGLQGIYRFIQECEEARR